MGATPIYGFPWPELASQADGPAAFQALAQKMEVTEANSVRPFTQVIPNFTISTSLGSHAETLSAVPLGRPVLLFVYANCRITSTTGQFGAYNIYEGVTTITASTAAQLGSGPTGSIVTPVMLVAARTFTVTPTLYVAVGGSTDTVNTTDIRATGFSFGWPS